MYESKITGGRVEEEEMDVVCSGEGSLLEGRLMDRWWYAVVSGIIYRRVFGL